MSNWIDYDMLMAEIGLHRGNAQREILHYKEKNKPMKTSPSEYTQHEFVDRLLYENEVGKEVILMCLENWCNDFKFSTEELKEFDEFKDKEKAK